MSYEQARTNRLVFDWENHEIASPWFIGRRYVDDAALGEIARYIDWTFFFSAWELKGRFPGVLDHPQYGPAARELYENAQKLLARIIEEKLLTPRGVYAFWPANTVDDDIVQTNVGTTAPVHRPEPGDHLILEVDVEFGIEIREPRDLLDERIQARLVPGQADPIDLPDQVLVQEKTPAVTPART